MDFDNINTADELLNATAMDIDLDVTDLDAKDGMSFGEKAGVASLIAIAAYAVFKGGKLICDKTGLTAKIKEKAELKRQLKEQAKLQANNNKQA